MALELHDIRIALPQRELLRIDSLVIEAGSTACIMGASGSGKSALLSYLCGVLPPAFQASGEVILNGEVITEKLPHKRKLGILFQSPLLFPHLSIAENLAFGIAHGTSKSERDKKIKQALKLAGNIDGALHESTLSGGEKSRIALMRVLLSSPQALLLDEAFSALDSELRTSFRKVVLENAKKHKLPILLVSHDKEDAKAFGGKILKIGN